MYQDKFGFSFLGCFFLGRDRKVNFGFYPQHRRRLRWGGVPSDRLWREWDLASRRARKYRVTGWGQQQLRQHQLPPIQPRRSWATYFQRVHPGVPASWRGSWDAWTEPSWWHGRRPMVRGARCPRGPSRLVGARTARCQRGWCGWGGTERPSDEL